MFQLETVEGATPHVNPVHVTYIDVDEKREGLTVVRLACGTTFRTKWPVSKVLKEFTDAVLKLE